VHYIVTVDAVFPARSASEYDVWEVQTLVDAARPIAALKQALSFSESANTWKLLRYRNKPILHGVRSIHEPLDSAEMAKIKCPHHWFVTKVATIDEDRLQRLKSFHEISLPFALMHIDGSNGRQN
jgi:hypothetical protein